MSRERAQRKALIDAHRILSAALSDAVGRPTLVTAAIKARDILDARVKRMRDKRPTKKRDARQIDFLETR